MFSSAIVPSTWTATSFLAGIRQCQVSIAEFNTATGPEVGPPHLAALLTPPR
jgi:hypothetical protein